MCARFTDCSPVLVDKTDQNAQWIGVYVVNVAARGDGDGSRYDYIYLRRLVRARAVAFLRAFLRAACEDLRATEREDDCESLRSAFLVAFLTWRSIITLRRDSELSLRMRAKASS